MRPGLTYRSPKAEVKASPIEGRGLFARACDPNIATRDLQERYRGWFCWFLQRRIEAEAS